MWRLRKATIRLERDREFADSPLEESGFEPSVPAATEGAPLGTKVGFALDSLLEGTGFEL